MQRALAAATAATLLILVAGYSLAPAEADDEPVPGILGESGNKGEYINETDGSVFVHVPGATYEMGNPYGDDDEKREFHHGLLSR